MARLTRLLSEVHTFSFGTEPFIIDPATGRSRLVRDINPGMESSSHSVTSSPTYGGGALTSFQGAFAALAGGLTVFSAIDPVNGQELWATDGTSAGTKLVAALDPGGSHPYYYSVGRSTSILTVAGSAARNFAVLDATRALFTAFDAANASRLWVTDGTAAGTQEISEAVPVTTDTTLPTQVVALGNGRALFAAADAAHGTELWVTDGTLVGTRLVRDLRPGTASSTPTSIAALGGGRAIFAATDDTGAAIWLTDGTEAGTTRLIGLSNPRYFTKLGNGLVVFENPDPAHGNELWVTDGTAAGTRLLVDIIPGASGAVQNNLAAGFGLLGNGRALFFATVPDPAGGAAAVTQLWSTDGTAAGTGAVQGFGQAANAAVSGFTALADGRVAFYASTNVSFSGPFDLGVGITAPALWVSDGTAGGTRLLNGNPNTFTLGGLSGGQLVDAAFYYGLYGDVAAAGAVSAQHYDASGWREGRDPDAFFSTPGYLNVYKDVGQAGINPLTHYDTNGWKEGRDPSAAFDTSLYLLFNPDVKAAGLDPLQHWLANGQAEGRKMSAVVDSAGLRDLFDPTFYGLGNPDVTAAGADLQTHFNTSGVAEGRNPNAYFDVKYYLAQNPDVAASGINPVAHYLNVGWKEGRDPSSHFSTTKYLAAYTDVKAAGINPLQHFLQDGINEGRSGFGDRI